MEILSLASGASRSKYTVIENLYLGNRSKPTTGNSNSLSHSLAIIPHRCPSGLCRSFASSVQTLIPIPVICSPNHSHEGRASEQRGSFPTGAARVRQTSATSESFSQHRDPVPFPPSLADSLIATHLLKENHLIVVDENFFGGASSTDSRNAG